MSEKSRIPNAVTCARFVLLIPFVWLVLAGSQNQCAWALAVLFVATLSDVLDGYLARKLNSVSDFGNLLDVMADRMLAVTLITVLVVTDGANIYLALAVICREVVADSIRSLAACSRSILPHNGFGRAKLVAVVSAMSSGLLAQMGVLSQPVARLVSNVLLAVALVSGVLSILIMRSSLQKELQPVAMRRPWHAEERLGLGRGRVAKDEG